MWKHHVVISSEFGITQVECESLQRVSYWRISALTDDLIVTQTIMGSTWERCNAFFEESEIIDIILIVSHYFFFSLVNNACVGVEPTLNEIPSLHLNLTN